MSADWRALLPTTLAPSRIKWAFTPRPGSIPRSVPAESTRVSEHGSVHTRDKSFRYKTLCIYIHTCIHVICINVKTFGNQRRPAGRWKSRREDRECTTDTRRFVVERWNVEVREKSGSTASRTDLRSASSRISRESRPRLTFKLLKYALGIRNGLL